MMSKCLNNEDHNKLQHNFFSAPVIQTEFNLNIKKEFDDPGNVDQTSNLENSVDRAAKCDGIGWCGERTVVLSKITEIKCEKNVKREKESGDFNVETDTELPNKSTTVSSIGGSEPVETTFADDFRAVEIFKRFRCRFCEYAAKTRWQLTCHFRATHDENFEFVYCDLCEYKTKHTSYLKRHKQKHSCTVEWHQCEFCERTCKSKNSLKKHVYLSHNENAKWYQCHLCEHKSKNKYSLKTHLFYMHNPSLEWLHCDLCGFKTKRKSNLRWHVKSKHTLDGERHQCHFCDVVLKTKDNLKRHIRHLHNENVKLYSCQLCGYQTKFKASSLRHNRNVHGGNVEIYRCLYCKYTSQNKALLESHSLKHNKLDDTEDIKIEVEDHDLSQIL